MLGFITGTYFYKIHYLNKAIASNINAVNQVATVTNTQTDNALDAGAVTFISANASGIKISPDCKLNFKTLYMICGHTLERTEKVSSDLVNLDEDTFKIRYPDWQVQDFSSDEIDLYKEVDDYCHQHYMLMDSDGYIGVYDLDKDDKVVGLNRMTNISTEYLTDTDVLNLQQGIRVYTDVNLNQTLEDFQ